tara:strand:+ start:2756 stop:3196 length:441 start_codon:yes stop_codon:yes gene_type:complete
MFKTYRNLKSLHNLYEQNFILINKLSGELNKHNKFSFQVGNLEIRSQVIISKKKLSKFTEELEFQINDVTGIKDIVIKCRTYNEAKMMEVIEFQNFHKDLLSSFKLKKINFKKDERLQWNLFMNQFLNYSILHGRAIEDYLPSWVQ